MRNIHKAVVSLIPSLVRLGRGAVAKGHRKRPERLLELYDGEYCPFCRQCAGGPNRTRSRCRHLSGPKKGSRFKEALKAHKGRTAVPFLHDANTGTRLSETLCELEIPYVLRNVGKSPGKMAEWLPPGFRLRVTKHYVPQTDNRRKAAGTRRAHASALPRGSEHERRDVRVRGHRALPPRDVRRVKGHRRVRDR